MGTGIYPTFEFWKSYTQGQNGRMLKGRKAWLLDGRGEEEMTLESAKNTRPVNCSVIVRVFSVILGVFSFWRPSARG